MNPFLQITAGQVLVGACSLLGMLGSAWMFTWKMGLMHGENATKMDALSVDLLETSGLIRHHDQEITSLRELAESSQQRLRLLEEEMRDNRKRRNHA